MDRPVIVFDHRGTGRSGSSPGAYSTRGLAGGCGCRHRGQRDGSGPCPRPLDGWPGRPVAGPRPTRTSSTPSSSPRRDRVAALTARRPRAASPTTPPSGWPATAIGRTWRPRSDRRSSPLSSRPPSPAGSSGSSMPSGVLARPWPSISSMSSPGRPTTRTPSSAASARVPSSSWASETHTAAARAATSASPAISPSASRARAFGRDRGTRPWAVLAVAGADPRCDPAVAGAMTPAGNGVTGTPIDGPCRGAPSRSAGRWRRPRRLPARERPCACP